MTLLQEELLSLIGEGQTSPNENKVRTKLWQERYNSTGNIMGVDNIEIVASVEDPMPSFDRKADKMRYGFKSKLFPDLPMRYIYNYHSEDNGLLYIEYKYLTGDNFFDGSRFNGLMLNKSFELFEKGYISGFIQEGDYILDCYNINYLTPVIIIKVNDQKQYDTFTSINNNIKQIYLSSKPFYYVPVYKSENEIVINAVYNKQARIFEFIGNNMSLIKENDRIKDVHCLDSVELANFTFPEIFDGPVDMLIYSKKTGVCLNAMAKTDDLIVL